MTTTEFYALLTRLQEKEGDAFERWYDTANFLDIKDYCRIGFLLTRSDAFPEEGTSQTPKI